MSGFGAQRNAKQKPGTKGVAIRLPEHYGLLSPKLHAVPLQLLAYHAATARGTDVDKPRNLAKSLAVEWQESARACAPFKPLPSRSFQPAAQPQWRY